jgi:hypothetical protein
MTKIDKKITYKTKVYAFIIQETKMRQTKLKQLKYLIFIFDVRTDSGTKLNWW